MHRECFRLFPDEAFADLFTDLGRRSIPPMIVAVVMVLQRLEGLSDREAVERFTYDIRWKYAAGGLDFDHPGFVHTVLVEMRARLARSKRPNRIFEATLAAAAGAGLVGRRRVLDSTPLYDAVATMDTVTLLRSGIRGVLAVAEPELEPELRALLRRDDDYASAGKPVCDYADKQAREALVDALAADANALICALDGREPTPALAEAATLLATLVGQDLDEGADGVFRIARRVATDRVISTVDPEARHGYKTAARSFDGYKGHVAIDPDSEVITATTVGPANAGDASAASELLADELAAAVPVPDDQPAEGDQPLAADSPVPGDQPAEGEAESDPAPTPGGDSEVPATSVYGDAAYGTGALIAALGAAGAEVNCKVPPPVAPGGLYTKDAFEIDLVGGTVSCPAERIAALRPAAKDSQIARFGSDCRGCPLAERCTSSSSGRTISVGPHEAELAAARARQAEPGWRENYTATRPKVERKIAHLMRRSHGGRRARVRGRPKVEADFGLLAAAVNLARLGVLGVHCRDGGFALGES